MSDLSAERLFAVVSWGAAATVWLAHALNECPDIFCVHQGNEMLREYAGVNDLPATRYFELLRVLGGGSQAAGDIHGITRMDVPVLRQKFGDIFRVVVLVRDPLPRLRSQFALLTEVQRNGREPSEVWGDLGYLDGLFPQVMRALPTGSYAERFFVHSVSMLNAILEESSLAPIVRMEDLTSRADALLTFVSELTGGTVTPPNEWAEARVAAPRMNPHVVTPLKLTDWQCKVLVDVFNPASISLYRALGYSVDIDALLANSLESARK